MLSSVTSAGRDSRWSVPRLGPCGGDLSNTGRIAVRSGAWGLIAFALGVWGGAALTAGLVVLASKVLTLVQALLAVGTIFLVLAAGAIAMARRRMRQLESPVQSVKRRAGEHLAWWQTEVTTESEGPSGGGSVRVNNTGPAKAEDLEVN